MAGAHQILLGIDTSVTCPKCEHEFSLEQGFAKKALESLEAASRDALTATQDAARVDAEKRAQALAAQQVKAAEQQVADLRKLLKEQGEANQKAIADVRAITEQAFKPQLDALRAQLVESQAKLTQMDQREAALTAREQSIESRVAAAAQAKAAELFAVERQAFEQRLADSQQQVAALRAQEIALRDAQQRLEDEKAAMTLDVRRQVDEQTKQREATVRAQEKERADLEKAELQKTIDDMKDKLAEAQRKAEQGSQQMQGRTKHVLQAKGDGALMCDRRGLLK